MEQKTDKNVDTDPVSSQNVNTAMNIRTDKDNINDFIT